MVKLIAGVDEVGRGPLAGPVVAAVVVFPADYHNEAFKDSKKLSPRQRRRLVPLIRQAACDWALGLATAAEIDQINIREASRLAMSRAVAKVRADLLLVDGNVAITTDLPQQTIVGGDALCVTISAASIIAKVFRDRLMCRWDRRYPGYGFSQHAGYPTREHRMALKRLGPSPIHRLSFHGVAPREQPTSTAALSDVATESNFQLESLREAEDCLEIKWQIPGGELRGRNCEKILRP